MKKIVQTAGRNALNEFAPQFAHFNDDVLFGENWNNQDIDVKTRCIITVTALIASGMINTSLVHHFENAKAHGVTQKEIAAVITHIAFYAGWPKGWAAFNLAKDVWSIDKGDLSYEDEAMRAHAKKMIFPIGEPNDKFAQYFTGKSFLASVSTSQVGIFNVTFEPSCRNIDTISRFHFYCFFSFFLIVSTSCNADKNLSASAFCMMNMPVIPATRFKSHIENSNL